MLDSHLAYIKVITDLVPACKLSDTLTVLSGLNILVWCKMIHNKCDFIFMKYTVNIHLLNLVNGNR